MFKNEDEIVNMFKELSSEAYMNALQHGFYSEDYAISDTLKALMQPQESLLDKKNKINMILARLGLVASEVGEAVRAVQHNNEEELLEELADICIRIFDICGWKQYDLGTKIISKMQINHNRPYKHNKLV